MVACYLKITPPNLDRIFELCNQVLQREPRNAKALFRRAQGQMMKNNFDKAEDDLKEALKIEPNNTGIKNELQTLQKKVAAEDKKQSKLLAGLFDKMKEEEEREEKEKEKKEKEKEPEEK
eukprot:TRINITY_DN2415_c0_g1_i1.p1 TRINITY_DN2415_c0_g1~~TRINITY_DN2415_c0_g1_i1.p1  ORF type:complete len:120 (-),score=57.43 TRINITY_DN2415_c0_g1_i1:13-372(-)